MAKSARRRYVRKGVVATTALAAALYFVPVLAIFYIAAGLVDVLRNERKDRNLFERYFLGNGLVTWLLAPLNLLADLLSYRNKRIYRLEDFSAPCRAEIEEALAVFVARRDEIVAEVGRAFDSGRRGMFVYRWYGGQFDTSVPEFNKPFKYVQTIAVSVFRGNESTGFHFGPLRLTLRVLYNLTPVQSERVFIECGRTKHDWHKDPLFIFDDTLMHRSANEDEARRYCVFMDVIRPSPVTPVLSVLLVVVSVVARRVKGIFYRNWKMLGANGAAAGAPGKSQRMLGA